ncbi:hypothetical protein JW879_01585 [candidate division WOR-3 bacterium]|nr:hypothetical protein [candidate division WOR-3 bacterium]
MKNLEKFKIDFSIGKVKGFKLERIKVFFSFFFTSNVGLMRKLLPLLTFLSLVCLGAEWDYTGTAYYVGNEDGNPTSIFRDGDYWYMVGNGNDSVYQYDNNWSYTGTAYYIGNEDGGATDLCKEGDYWYIVGNDNDSIFQYDTNWVYTGNAYYIGSEDATPTGIRKDGAYWYMIGIANDRIYQYDESWSYTGTSYYVGGEDGTPPQIHKDGTYWYMSGYDNDRVYRYDNNWSYTGTSYYIGGEDGWPSGIYRYGNYWYMSGNDNDSVYVYEGTLVIPSTPTLIRIFDNALFNAWPPPYVCTLSVVSTDPQSDDIQYELQWDTDYGFSSASSEITDVYSSGDAALETILLGATPAEAETLFYWRARARDPGGSNVWSDWSVIRSFIMDLALGDDLPYWYQCAENQFAQCAMDNVIVQGNSVVFTSTAQIEFQRASGSTGASHSIDIGSPGNNRLVVVVASDENTGTSLTNVTVDGNDCTKAGEADNSSDVGNHQELWYILESGLGSSSGTVNVAISGGDGEWATHVHVYYGVEQSGPLDFEIEEAVINGNTISVENVSSSDGSVVIFGAGEGTGGLTPSWTSPLSVRTNGPDPSSADLATASGIESSGQTDKTYVCTWSGNFNRGTGIVAVWEPAATDEGTLTSHPVAYGDLLIENSSRSNWDGAKWTKSSADDSIGLQIQYLHDGSWDPVPDSDLPANSNYFFQMSTSFCNVDLSGLNITTYDTLRLVAKFRSYAAASDPTLIMWALGETGGITSIPLGDDGLRFALYLPGSNVLVRRAKIEIKYQLPREENVRLGVFDLLGREVATLVDTKKSRGIHSITWQGKNNYNKSLACGVYFLKMEAGEFRDIKKLVFVR